MATTERLPLNSGALLPAPEIPDYAHPEILVAGE